LTRIGIYTIGQLRSLSLKTLEESFGKYGSTLYYFARGQDARSVEPDIKAKSIGKEVTFARDVGNMEELRRILLDLSEKIGRRLRQENIKCTAVTLKIKYPDLKIVTRTATLIEPTGLTGPIYETAVTLLKKHCHPPVRLIGITCGKFSSQTQNILFKDRKSIKEEKITPVLDKLKDRYGEEIVTVASLLTNNKS